MEKKKAGNEVTPELEDIKTPRQLASLYQANKLENFFVRSSKLFFERLERPFKEEADAFETKIIEAIVKMVREKRLTKDAVKLIDSITLKKLVYLALYDFGLAIYNFQTVMSFVREYNKMFIREKKKAISCIDKLLNNRAPGWLDKELGMLHSAKEKIIKSPSEEGGHYYPLYFFYFLKDLRYSPGEQIDTLTLQRKLDGRFIAMHIRFPKNRRSDLFLLNALIIVIYDLLVPSIKIDSNKRYQREKTNRNREAEKMTAVIINSYVQKTKLKHLPTLTGESVYTTLYRNPA